MHQGMLVFAQVMAHLPLSTFRRCVAAHRGDHKEQEFSCLDQFLTMAFAQLTTRESLRDIEVNLRAQSARLYHMRFRCKTISRNTLSNPNAMRPWQMYADFAQHLIGIARPLYADEPFAVDLDATVYAFDATTIDLCLSVYPWAPFRSAKAAIKLHTFTLLDLHGAIPSFIHITDGKTHEVNVLDELIIEPGRITCLTAGQANDYSWLGLLFDEVDMTPAFRLENLRRILNEDEAARWHAAKDAELSATPQQRHRASTDARVIQQTLARLRAES